MPFYKDIISQLDDIQLNIESSFKRIGNDKFIFIEYEDLCNNTPKVIKSILQKLNSRGLNLNEKGQEYDIDYNTANLNINLPDLFPFSMERI